MNKEETKDYLLEYLQINIRDVEEYTQIESYILDLFNTQPNTSTEEIKLIKLLLITLQAYQDNLDKVIKRDSIDLMTYATVQGLMQKFDIEKLSKANIKKINSFSDLLTFFISKEE